MRIHYLQHVPHEGPGTITDWARERGVELVAHHVYRGDEVPGPSQGDALVILGGPMSVHDEAELPWLLPEKQAIRRWIAAGKPMLGICLGGQLIAQALGAAVTRNRVKEIGWFPIQRLPEADATLMREVLPAELEVYHWHGETFGIPDGARAIARSEACANQGFVYDERVVGLQFHLETDTDTVRAFSQGAEHELAAGGLWVQTVEEMLAKPERFEVLRGRMYALLDAWAG